MFVLGCVKMHISDNFMKSSVDFQVCCLLIAIVLLTQFLYQELFHLLNCHTSWKTQSCEKNNWETILKGIFDCQYRRNFYEKEKFHLNKIEMASACFSEVCRRHEAEPLVFWCKRCKRLPEKLPFQNPVINEEEKTFAGDRIWGSCLWHYEIKFPESNSMWPWVNLIETSNFEFEFI